jgi:hypothetical protein
MAYYMQVGHWSFVPLIENCVALFYLCEFKLNVVTVGQEGSGHIFVGL